MIQRHKTRGAGERYKEIRKIEKRIQWKKNKAYFEEQTKLAEKLQRQKRGSRRMYHLVNNVTKEFKPCMTPCRGSTGILNEPSKIMEWWRQHFQNLMRDPNIISMEITQELGKW
jgi:hypothetical protein